MALIPRIVSASALAALLCWTGAVAVGSDSLAGPVSSWDQDQKKEQEVSEREREKLLAAQERADLRRRAAEEAERVARELEAAAAELEALADKAERTAVAARKRADAAAKRAQELNRRVEPSDQAPGQQAAERDGPTQRGGAEAPGTGAPRAGAQPRQSAAPSSGPAREKPQLVAYPIEQAKGLAESILASAGRTAEENKQAYLAAMREGRGWDPALRRKDGGKTYSPGEAPDLADIDFYAEWQWCLNIARGRGNFTDSKPGVYSKTGHVDLARLTLQPAPGTFAETGLKWGMRRYNLGDVTVTDCDFTGIPREHGIYDNVSGHALYRGNTFLRLGGQAIQIAHRDRPYQQYGADNLAYTASPLMMVEDCHAVDCGLFAGRAGFVYTFFDPGTTTFPGTVVLRGCTAVCAWDFTRTSGGDRVGADHPRAIRSPGGLVLQHYGEIPQEAEAPPTRDLVIDSCLFDLTMGENPVAAVRGVGTIHVEDSVFLARDHRNPFFDVDDIPGQPSGRVILQNCVSPPGKEVWLRIRRKKVRSMHCPGKRFEIDVATLEVRELPMTETALTRVVSPLAERTVASGVHPQAAGHADDLGALDDSKVR